MCESSPYDLSVVTGLSQRNGKTNLNIQQSRGEGGSDRHFPIKDSQSVKKLPFIIAFYPNYDITTVRKVI